MFHPRILILVQKLPFVVIVSLIKIGDPSLNETIKIMIGSQTCQINRLFLAEVYEGISMIKFNNIKMKRVESKLKYTVSKLVKKKTMGKGKKTKKATIM